MTIRSSKEAVQIEDIYIGEVWISKESITVTYSSEFLPVKLKYAWAPYPENNLVNSADLPMAPFIIELTGNN